jgi:hypothetical protein
VASASARVSRSLGLAESGWSLHCAGGRATRKMADCPLSKHAHYLRTCLIRGLSENYCNLDSNRLTLVYFCVSGLDLMYELKPTECTQVVRWVKAQMIVAPGHGGFRGSPFFVSTDGHRSEWDVSHIAMTYTGLAILAICGDDLNDIDRAPIRSLIRSLQREDGGVKCHALEDDTDLRFLFRLPHCPLPHTPQGTPREPRPTTSTSPHTTTASTLLSSPHARPPPCRASRAAAPCPRAAAR